MKKRVLLNCLFFLLILLATHAQAADILCASAPSGTHVYRASVGPRPKSAQVAPAPKAKKVPASVVETSEGQSEASCDVSPQASQAPQAPQDSAGMIKQPVAAITPLAVPAPKTSAAGKPKAQPVSKAKAEAKAKTEPQARTEPKAKAASQAGADSKTEAKAASAKTPKGDPPATSKDLYLNVQAAFLVNMSTGQVYYEHNPDKTIQPASITKLLTLYLVREALAAGQLAPSTPIPISATAVKTGGSRMRLKRGEKVPLNELIKGISVVSANNACVAVAEYMGGGDPSKFVAQMNAKAKKIGMTSSRFKNPSGLPDRSQLSTARDIAKLSMNYLRAFPEALKIHSMTSHTYHGSTHRNANSLLKTYKGVDGLKTGFVCEAGYNITATAKRGDTRLLAVVLGAQSAAVRQRETRKLLDFGFQRATRDNGLGNRADAGASKPGV